MTDIKDEDIWKKQLLSTVRTFRRLSGDMRFGQFLFNALADDYKKRNKGTLDMNFNEDFHSLLFYVEDDRLSDILEQAIAENDLFLATLKST